MFLKLLFELDKDVNHYNIKMTATNRMKISVLYVQSFCTRLI